MNLITTAHRQKLLDNGRAQRAALDQKQGAIGFEPVVKIFTADGNATWLLTELEPNGYLAFGLCDLGQGEPELGYVSLHELAAARGSLGLYPSSAISTSRRRERSRPTRSSPASIGASSPDGSSGASAARRPTLNCGSLE